MKRLNMTLAVEVVSRWRTSVNELVRKFMERRVSQDGRRIAALDRIQPLLERPSVRLGRLRPTRDQLHER